MGVGRFVCVALPFALTTASLICILIVMLAGVTNHNLDMFEVNTQNLSISSSSLENLESLVERAHFSDLTTAALTNAASTTTTTSSGINITAADLSLADKYKVSLWNYCYTSGSNTTCSKAKFGWASSALNTTAIEKLASSATGETVTLPKELTSSLKTFTVFSKWTDVVYIIAFIACVVELFFGIFAICSRCGSCLTFLVSGISTVTIVAASIMATVQSSIVVGTVESTAKAYGVKASLNTSFLATTWLAAAFSIGGGLFWMFTICCCAADHHKRTNRRNRDDDAEKLIPTGAYQRVGEPDHFQPGAYAGQQQGIYAPQQQYGVPTNNKPMRGNGACDAGAFSKALTQVSPGKNLLAFGDLITWEEYVKLWSKITGFKASFERKTVQEHDKLAPGGYGEEMGEMYAYAQEFGYWGRDPSVIYGKDLGVEIPVTRTEDYIKRENWSELINRPAPAA